jgi:hypothetical protein
VSAFWCRAQELLALAEYPALGVTQGQGPTRRGGGKCSTEFEVRVVLHPLKRARRVAITGIEITPDRPGLAG